MIENISTPCGSGYFQPPPLIDLPENLPEGADYKPYLFELIHRHGRPVFNKWLSDRCLKYEQELNRVFNGYGIGETPSNQREFEMFQKYFDFVKRVNPSQKNVKNLPFLNEYLYGDSGRYGKPPHYDHLNNWKGEFRLFRENLLNGKISKADFDEIYFLYEKELYEGIGFPSATLTVSIPKTAKAQNRQLKRVGLYA